MGVLEEAETVLVGACEAAFFVAEEFAFHQVFWDGATVYGDERAVFARREFVDAARGLFFTRAAFARNVNGHVGGGELADKVAHGFNLRRRAEQARQVGFHFELALVYGHGGFAGGGFGGAARQFAGCVFRLPDGFGLFGDGSGGGCCGSLKIVFVIDADDNGRRLGRSGLRLGFGSGRRRAVVFLHFDGGFHQRAQLRQRNGFLQIVKRAFF